MQQWVIACIMLALMAQVGVVEGETASDVLKIQQENNPVVGAVEKTAISGRTLDWITIKRNEIHPSGEDKYGHYWIEILDGPNGKPVESYGWWPKYPLSPDLTGAVNTLGGVSGELNGITSFKGTPTNDPHQGTTAEKEFHPILMNDYNGPAGLR